jgi:hypothetical protein
VTSCRAHRSSNAAFLAGSINTVSLAVLSSIKCLICALHYNEKRIKDVSKVNLDMLWPHHQWFDQLSRSSITCNFVKPRLKLIQYTPYAGYHPQVCAAMWRQGCHVRLISPLLRQHDCEIDLLPISRQFGDELWSVEAFVDAMQWLDATCFSATDPREVQQACAANPEWNLCCVRYASSSADTLCSASNLLHAVLDPK